MASKGLYANINARKKAGTSRPKSESTVSSKAYKNMQAGFPKKMKEGGMLKAVPEDKKKSLGKLPTPVREKMGFMREGGPTSRAQIQRAPTSRAQGQNPKRLSKEERLKRRTEARRALNKKYTMPRPKGRYPDSQRSMKPMKEGGEVIVDRQYLKGK